MATIALDPRTLSPSFAAEAKWGWSCRHLRFDTTGAVGPLPTRSGDVCLARVSRIGSHGRIVDRSGARRRIYPGDLVVGVLGHRYATDAFHGRAEHDDGRAHLMTNAGMMGWVHERHAQTRGPTSLEILGGVLDAKGHPVNLIDLRFRPRREREKEAKVVLMLGTGMNAGKTTSACKLVRGLAGQGLEVAALKITGSVSPGDRSELEDAGASYVSDFSDYGFPSTYLLPEAQLQDLAGTMLADAESRRPDVIVAEVADGVLQRETTLLLRHLRSRVDGTVLAAACALSAIAGAEVIERLGHRIHAVTGLISNAPLFVSELADHGGRKVVTSADDGEALGEAVARSLGVSRREAA